MDINRNKPLREALSKYFFDLSKLAFVTFVLGGGVLFFQSLKLSLNHILMAGFGVIVSGTFAVAASLLLKNTES
ncbi:hypothetical protein Barb6_01544 [Bacteroidales bacterium Barb6]|nr:hypothetical protein Barb6_01544 [Bacteroidales bacterium Barb6]